MSFSNAEMADMVFVYFMAEANASRAQRMYSERYPNRRLPHSQTFQQVFHRLRETGTFKKDSRLSGRRPGKSLQRLVQVIRLFGEF